MTPPPRTRAEVDGGILAEDFHVPLGGREDSSEYGFTMFDDPDDSTVQAIDTLFESKAEASWLILYTQSPGPSSGFYSDEFKGRVIGLAPDARDPSAPATKSLVVRRTSAITRANTTTDPPTP